MNIDRVSPSSYNSWDGCQMQYYLEQNLKYRFPAGKAADMGTVAHEVLEILAKIKLQEQEDPENRVLTLRKGEVDLDNYTIEGLTEMARSSYRSNYFTKKDRAQIDAFVNTAITFRNGEFDPRNRTIIEPEKRVKIQIPEDWAILPDGNYFAFSGIVDLITQVDDNTYQIIDWKTGGADMQSMRPKDWNTGKLKTYGDFFNDPQLRFYHWAASQIYGKDKDYLLTIFFLKLEQEYTIPFTVDDLQKTELILRNRFETVTACEKPRRNQTWKCRKMCPFGKMTPADTQTKFPVKLQDQYGGIAQKGEEMTICDCANHFVEKAGVDIVEKYFAKNSKEDIPDWFAEA